VVQGIFLLLISFCPEAKKEMVPWCTERYISSQIIPRQPPLLRQPLPPCVDGRAEVDAVDFELEEDDLMDDDTTMDDGNADIVPTPMHPN
jgi:hypothetical protein